MNTVISSRALAEINNRAITCFLGQMTGDALGARYEFSQSSFHQTPLQVIQQDVDKTGFLPILGGGIFKVDPGQITDDTEMALALVDVLRKSKKIMGDNILKGYQRWAASQPFDMGNNTRYIFTHPKIRTTEDARYLAARYNQQAKDQYGEDNLSNGVLMRISPLGIIAAPMMYYSINESPLLIASNLINLAGVDTNLSHSSDTAVVASGVFIAIVAGNIAYGRQGLDLTLEIAGTIARQDSQIKGIFDRAINGQLMNPPPTEKIGFLGTALHLAIHRTIQVAKSEISFHRAMVATVELGGDTDTNCAIVGAAIGGLVDLKEIPKQWVESVLNCENKPFMQQRQKEFHPYKNFELGHIHQLIKIGLHNYTFKMSKTMVANCR